MRKHLLSVWLCLCMLVTLLPLTAIAADTMPTSGSCGADDHNVASDNVTWQLSKPDANGNYTLTISGAGYMKSYSRWEEVPWSAASARITKVNIRNGVTTIGDWAFANCSLLTQITIPNSIVSINTAAFKNSGLTSITIPKSVNMIWDNAFMDCSNLKTAVITSDIEGLFVHAPFLNSGLTTAIFANGVTEIPNRLFAFCSNLAEITIPESVVQISELFSDCTSLKNINVAPNNKIYMSDNGVLLNKEKTRLIKCPAAKTEYKIPATVTEIESGAFSSSKITSIEIPDSVTEIPNDTFNGCSQLEFVKIPDSVTEIGLNAFENCTNLSSVVLPPNIDCMRQRVFYGCSKLNSIIIPDGVKDIWESAFEKCSGLTSISLPVSLEIIGKNSFLNCNNLKAVYYSGTKEQWEKINNRGLTGNNIIFNANKIASFVSVSITESTITVCEYGNLQLSTGLEAGFRPESGYWNDSNAPIIYLAQYTGSGKMVKTYQMTRQVESTQINCVQMVPSGIYKVFVLDKTYRPIIPAHEMKI